jgi:hypothetical protein
MPRQKNGNGLALLERFIPDGLSHAATAVIESLKINSISEKVRRGRRVVVKRRNIHGAQMADLANFYFRRAGVPIRFWSKMRDWQRWEVGCFQMLNGDRFRASTMGTNAVCVDKLPGQSIWVHMQKRTLTRSMLTAAANEFRRAHQFWSKEFDGPWSHGDASAPNVIYNERSARARLIDFEIIHVKSLPATTRQADDLLVFLLDMVALVSSRQWLPFALCFVKTYGKPEVIAELKKQLVIPNGLARIWWGVRTNFIAPAKAQRRLEELRRAIGKPKPYRISPRVRHPKAGALR